MNSTVDTPETEELRDLVRQVFWEEAPRLRQEIYEGELGRLRAEIARQMTRVWEAIEKLTEAQQRTEQEVRRLAEAQQRTEQRVEHLEQVVAQLAEAQQRTEQEVRRLAEAQQRTEQRVEHLEQIVAQLAEAQQRTEQRLERLEKIVAELIEAQRRTEEEVRRLAEAQQRLEEQLAEVAKGLNRLQETVWQLQKQMRLFTTYFGAELEVDAEETLEWVLTRKGYRVVGEVRIVDIDGDVDVALPVESPEGRRLWAITEVKVRLRRKEYLNWVRLLTDPGYIRRLSEEGIEKPLLPYAFGLRVYHTVVEIAPEHGVGVIDARGERVEARPFK